SVFESFSKSFVIDWINNNPSSAVSVASSSDLRNFFGKQIIDIGIIGDHGFDLSRSMGHVLFNERRLDSLSVIREVFKSLFSSSVVQSALGDQLWLLNQRRHLFVHKRGVVDTGYLSKTAALENKGDRLVLTSDDVKKHLVAVRDAIVAIGNVSTHT
ncbi:MAG: hypothetical protein ACK4NW_11690, partial [Roseinatronobacter sp.]